MVVVLLDYGADVPQKPSQQGTGEAGSLKIQEEQGRQLRHRSECSKTKLHLSEIGVQNFVGQLCLGVTFVFTR
jgi:hypothetical protein